MNTFWARVLTLIMVVGVIFGYNTVLEARENEDTIAKMTAELETGKLKLEQLEAREDSKTQEGAYIDGVYSGEADGFGGTVAVDVTVENGQITAVDITDASGEDGAYLDMATAIIDEILEQQTAEVDTISGATFSSTGIKNAAMQALEEAER